MRAGLPASGLPLLPPQNDAGVDLEGLHCLFRMLFTVHAGTIRTRVVVCRTSPTMLQKPCMETTGEGARLLCEVALGPIRGCPLCLRAGKPQKKGMLLLRSTALLF